MPYLLDFSRTSLRRLLTVIFIAGLSCALITSKALAQSAGEDVISSSQAKAVLLYNFIKHTQFPDKEKPVIEVGFLGTSEAFVAEFKRIASEASVKGRSISPQTLDSYDQAGKLEVLVLAPKYNRSLSEIATLLSKTQTLIVSDAAEDRTSVMINFSYPNANKISFEVNKHNIIYEGLRVSNDVLLYGGTEIEVAELYNKMEQALIEVKQRLRQQESILFEQEKMLDKQASQARDQQNLIDQKNRLILDQTNELSQLTLEIQMVDNRLNQSLFQLDQSKRQIVLAQEQLTVAQEKSQVLNTKIAENQRILSNQDQLISTQGIEIESKDSTIELQRNIILLAFLTLCVVAAAVIARQKRDLVKERLLMEEKQKLVEAQKESIDAYQLSLKVKNDFMAAINHELKTPMHIILSALHNIQQGGELEANLEFISSGSQHMNSLISDMLMYTEVQSKSLPVNVSSATIQQSLEEVVKKSEVKLLRKPVVMQLHVQDKFPQYALLDIEKLTTVFEKLLDNAIKYTKHGRIDVYANCILDEPEAVVEVTIADTGIGITEQDLETIFEPFTQHETGMSRRYDGLGIGLSICRSLMDLLKGSIRISSQEGRGTEVTIRLPVEVQKEDHIELSKSQPPVLSGNTEDQLILLVEDNDVSRLVMERMIKGLGYQCKSASSAREALEIIFDDEPDLVLMDVQMPDVDGIACTKIIRESEVSQPPIVAVTANLMDHISEECLQAGMQAVLSKPLSPEKLVVTIKQYISQKIVNQSS